jgi:hypothetical protein
MVSVGALVGEETKTMNAASAGWHFPTKDMEGTEPFRAQFYAGTPGLESRPL